MFTKIRNKTNKFENPKCPLLGPIVKWLQIFGLLETSDNKVKKAMYLLCYFISALFIFTEYIDIWMVRSDTALLLQNAKFCMLSSVGLVKVVTFMLWRNDWQVVIEFVTETDLDRRRSKNRFFLNILNNSKNSCRNLVCFYWFIAMLCTALITICQPIVENVLSLYYDQKMLFMDVVYTWTPWDKTTLPGYLVSLILQIAITWFGMCAVTAFDLNVFSILIFFKCELKLLRRDSKFIFGTPNNPLTKAESKVRLAKCHKRHNELLKFSRILDSCLSPIMFLYVIVCSFMICSAAFQLTNEKRIRQIIFVAVYLIFGVVQLFMYCWHSYEVCALSNNLSLGLYESIWWSRDTSEMQDLIILSHQFRKSLVLSAGPFANINITTLMRILKGAYSYYTIINQTN